MLFQRNPFLFVALLVLSAGSTGAQDFTKEALESAIEKAAGLEGTLTCNPFVDVGCHVPVPQTPNGCTDCAPGQQLADFLARDGTIILPNDLTINGAQIDILRPLNGDATSIFGMPAQVGY